MERILKNVMEVIVEQRLEEMLPSLNCCDCEQCRMDIMALVLNRLPARYVVTQKGELMSRLDSYERQNAADLTKAIVEAAKIVADNPNHGDQ